MDLLSARNRLPVGAVLVVVVALLVATVTSAGMARAQDLEDERSRLDEVRRQEDAAENRLQDLEHSDVELASEIEEAALQLEQAAAELVAAEQRLATSLETLREAEAELGAARRAVRDAESDFRRRAARAAAHPQLVPDTAILGSDDPTMFSKTAVISQVVLEGDVAAIETLVVAREGLDAEVARLAAAAQAADAARTEAQTRHDDVEARRVELEAAREALQARIAESQAEVEALAREEAEVVALIRRQEEAARAAAAAAAAAAAEEDSSGGGGATSAGGGGGGSGGGGGGALRWPAQGWASSEFGPRWGRNHNGLDIAAPTGTTVMAAASGVVFHAGPLGSFGNLVAIDHGGGRTTFYAHLNTVEVGNGQWVDAGQRIAGVGSTGRSTGPHLHFEVRQGGVPANPRGFLG